MEYEIFGDCFEEDFLLRDCFIQVYQRKQFSQNSEFSLGRGKLWIVSSVNRLCRAKLLDDWFPLTNPELLSVSSFLQSQTCCFISSLIHSVSKCISEHINQLRFTVSQRQYPGWTLVSQKQRQPTIFFAFNHLCEQQFQSSHIHIKQQQVTLSFG